MSEKKPFIDLIGKIKFDGTQKQIDENPKGWRAYFVCTYAKKEQLQDIFAYCNKFAWITHDRDVDADGKPKAIHSHFIVRYTDQLTPTAFAKRIYRLVNDEQTIISPLGDKYCAVDYMLHRDAGSIAKGKTLYKESEIITDDIAYFLRTKEEAKAQHNNEEFFADLFGSTLSRREMALKYGRDYAKNATRYDLFKKQVLQEEWERDHLTEETKKETYTDMLEVCEAVVRRTLHFYLPSRQMADDAYISAQIAHEMQNVMLAEKYFTNLENERINDNEITLH